MRKHITLMAFVLSLVFLASNASAVTGVEYLKICKTQPSSCFTNGWDCSASMEVTADDNNYLNFLVKGVVKPSGEYDYAYKVYVYEYYGSKEILVYEYPWSRWSGTSGSLTRCNWKKIGVSNIDTDRGYFKVEVHDYKDNTYSSATISFNLVCYGDGDCDVGYKCLSNRCRQCSVDADCPSDIWTGTAFCQVGGNNVYQNFRDYSCSSYYCQYTDSVKLKEVCDLGCENGACRMPSPPEPECSSNLLYTCSDGSIITQKKCINGFYVSTTEICPITECFSDLLYICPDGSIITQKKCINGFYVSTTEICPSPECTSNLLHVCPDGSVIVQKQCIGGYYVATEEVCPTAPRTVFSMIADFFSGILSWFRGVLGV